MVGQEHVGRTLGNAIRQNRVHHAYLFAGARGLGKTTTARIFAKGLVCETGPTPNPCNACEQCVAVNEGRSVDVLEIDGASNNSVENIRGLREQVHYLPQSARRKVYIIDEVHMLTTSAFNALLKTLEEPPAHVNFIFATTEPQKVLPTILSRVSRLDFRRVSVEESVAHLRSILEREGLGVDDGGLRLIARASGGSVRDSLTLLDQVIAFADDPKHVTEDEARRVLGQADRTAVGALIEAVVARDPDAVIERFDALVAGGLDLMVLSLQILEHLRDLTLASVCQGRAALGDVTEAEYRLLKKSAELGDPVLFGQFFDRFSRVVDRLPASRVQRLLIEMALLDLAHSEPLVPLGDLVDQLQRFADGGPPGGGTSGPPPSRGRPRASEAATRGRAEAGRPGRATQEAEGFASPAAEPARASGPASWKDAPRDTEDAAPRFESSGSFSPPPFEPASPPEPSPAPGSSATSAPASPSGPSASFAPSRSVSPPPFEPSASSSPPSEEPPWPTDGPAGPAGRYNDRNGSTPPNGAAARPSDRTSAQPATPSGESEFAESALMEGLWKLAKGAVFAKEEPLPAEPSPPPASERPATASPLPASCPSGCGDAPPREGVIDLDRLPQFEAWVALVERIRKEDEYVSAVLSDVGLVSLADGILRIAAPLRSFAHNELHQRPEIRAQVEQATRDHFGRPFRLELVEGEAALPDCPSIVLVDAQRRENHRRTVESEAQQHAAIRSVLQMFNAQLTATRPLHDLPP